MISNETMCRHVTVGTWGVQRDMEAGHVEDTPYPNNFATKGYFDGINVHGWCGGVVEL